MTEADYINATAKAAVRLAFDALLDADMADAIDGNELHDMRRKLREWEDALSDACAVDGEGG